MSNQLYKNSKLLDLFIYYIIKMTYYIGNINGIKLNCATLFL